MNDPKTRQAPVNASRTDQLVVGFEFTVPLELLPNICVCPPNSNPHETLDLPPSMGVSKEFDDLGPETYVP